MVIRAVAVLAVYTSAIADGLDNPPLTADQLPSEPIRETPPAPGTDAPTHRLSKRFIDSLRGYELKRSSGPSDSDLRRVTWSLAGDRLHLGGSGSSGGGSPWQGSAKYKTFDPRYDDDKDKDKDMLDFILGFSKPKRYFGLLPAKEPRRKDLPPRLGEESAPRFARTFSFSPDGTGEQRLLPSARRMTSSDLRKYKNSGGVAAEPIDYAGGPPFWGQRFRVDTPININNMNVDLGLNDVPSSSGDPSDYSTSDDVDYPEMTYESEMQDKNFSSTSSKLEVDQLKNYVHQLLSHLDELARLQRF